MSDTKPPAPSQPTPEARVELEALRCPHDPGADDFHTCASCVREGLASRSAPTPGYREGWEAGREAAAAWHDIQAKAIDNVARCASDNAAYLGSADYQKIARHVAAAAAIRALPLPESALLTKAARCGECGRDVLVTAAPAPVETPWTCPDCCVRPCTCLKDDRAAPVETREEET